MKVILNKDVPNLGEEGDICEVARGYARNYLIPRGFGVLHTPQNLALLSSKRKAIEKHKEEKRQAALGLKSRIEELAMVLEMTAGEGGRLFGSVTSATIIAELAKAGIQVERKKVEIADRSIRSTGSHIVRIRLYGSEVAQLKVQVVSSAKKPQEAAESKAPASHAAAAPAAPAPEASSEPAESQQASEHRDE